MWLLLIAALADPRTQSKLYTSRGCAVEALTTAGEGLRETPGDAELHRLYVAARYRYDHDLADLTRMYRSWSDAAPEDFALKVGAATALAFARDVDCDRLESLLADRAEQPAEMSFQAVRARAIAAQDCGWDDVEADYRSAADRGSEGAGRRARYLAGSEDPSEVTPEQVVADLEAEPLMASKWAWKLFDAEGAGAHRRALKKLAKTWADDAEPVRRMAAADLYRHAGDLGLYTKLKQALQDEDPCVEPFEGDTYSALFEKIWEAQQQPTHELALAALDALAGKIPESGKDRAFWQDLRQERLSELGRDDEAYAALKDSYEADPSNTHQGLYWTLLAARRGADLEAVVEALGTLIPKLQQIAWKPRTRGFPEWQESRSKALARAWDTRGWALHQLGRHEAATEAFQVALAFEPNPTILAHAGLNAVAGEEDGFALLREAYAHGTPHEAVDADARAALEPLYEARAVWHPEGFEGWLADLERPEDAEKQEGRGLEGPLHGERFPIPEAATLTGGDAFAVPTEGVVVVDMWASWCGPCVQGMPHLQEIATRYADRGVQVVGLSVDERRADAVKFFRKAEVDYQLGWIGKDGWKAARLGGIPTLFVLVDGVVEARIIGYSSGDDRLETVLEKVL